MVMTMAKTKGGNPVIGTVTCFSPGCDETASVHQIATGSREGELYTRCPECKANQSTGKPFQKYLGSNADFREGFESLSTKDQVPETEQDEETVIDEDEVLEGELMPIDEPEKKSVSGKTIGVVIGVVALALLGTRL